MRHIQPFWKVWFITQTARPAREAFLSCLRVCRDGKGPAEASALVSSISCMAFASLYAVQAEAVGNVIERALLCGAVVRL